MSKPFQILLLSFLVLTQLSCSKEETQNLNQGSLEISLRATYGTDALVTGKNYPYFNRGVIQINKSEFFMSDLSLKRSDTTIVLKEIEYISLAEHHSSPAKAMVGLKLRFDDIPVGEYDALSFLIGLTEARNQTSPADYSASHPMGEGIRYWAGGNSYMFSKLEGLFNDSLSTYHYFYHSGLDAARRTFEWRHTISIQGGQTTGLILYLDHSHLFAESENGIDIASNPYVHVLHPVMDGIMDRYVEAFRME